MGPGVCTPGYQMPRLRRCGKREHFAYTALEASATRIAGQCYKRNTFPVDLDGQVVQIGNPPVRHRRSSRTNCP